MVFGRLDVFWPDGRFKTFTLTNPNTSIGRASGNVIALDTDTISRYHITLTHDSRLDEIQLTDLESANGTYLDGVRLPAGEGHALRGGEEILIGDLRIIFHAPDASPTQPIIPVLGAMQRATAETTGFQIAVRGPDQHIAPGAHISACLTIVNSGAQARRFLLRVSGLPNGWVRLDRGALEIDPGDSGEAILNFRPARRSESVPGAYPVNVAVVPEDSPDTVLQVQVLLRVLPFSGFGMALEARHISAGKRFRLHIHNQGSINLPLSIAARNVNQDLLRFQIAPAQVALAPGQRLVINGDVRPHSNPLVGGPHEYPFDVLVRSQDDAGFTAAVRGFALVKPSLPTWAVAAAGAGALTLLVSIVLALVLLLGGSSPPPVVHRFDVSPRQVEQGGTLNLQWAVSDARRLSVSVNGVPVVTDVAPDAPGLSFALGPEYLGEVNVMLEAVGGDDTAFAPFPIEVHPPLTVDHFRAEPAQLTRFVVQPLTLDWRVTGAESVFIDGLQAFTTTPLEPEYSPEASVAGIVGIPLNPFTLTLHATGMTGRTIEQSLTVNVINPECTPARDGLRLHFGPDAAHQVVGTVPAGTSVVVDAQDGSGRWLRALLPGGVSGWGPRSELVCAETFNIDSLRKELNTPPLPTSTPGTPTPTPVAATPAPTLPPLLEASSG